MDSRTVWLMAYLVLGALIYITYVIGLRNAYPSKMNVQENNNIVGLLTISFILFMVSAGAMWSDYQGLALLTLFFSILLDSISATMIGDKVVVPGQGQTTSLGLIYTTVSSPVYKLLLFAYFYWVAGLKECGMDDPLMTKAIERAKQLLSKTSTVTGA